jgi:hypothetical protein
MVLLHRCVLPGDRVVHPTTLVPPLLAAAHLDFVRLFNEPRQVLHAAGGREGAWDGKHDHLLAFAQLVCAQLLHVALSIKVAELGVRELVPDGQRARGDADAAAVWPYAAGDTALQPLEGAAPAAEVGGLAPGRKQHWPC